MTEPLSITLDEIWIDVAGYGGAYQVSSIGNVRSVDCKRSSKRHGFMFVKGQVLSKNIDRHGYVRVRLSINGRGKSATVHRLMMLSFFPVGNANDLHVNHKDGNKANNLLENLEWCTPKENAQHTRKVLGKATGTAHFRYGMRGDKYWMTPLAGKLNARSKPVEMLNADGQVIKAYESAHMAAKDGFSQSTISHVCNGKLKTHKGYFWRFANV